VRAPTPPGGGRQVVTARYDRLLAALERAPAGWDALSGAGRSAALSEAANIVFDLLYTLDYERGGELVPRLAGVYAYIADELLTIGRTHDVSRLEDLRKVVAMLRAAA
jgi:flagellar biosynthetic protein FliS